MFKSTCFISLLVILCAVPLLSQSQNIKAEKKAIKKVIIAAEFALLDRDSVTHHACFAQDRKGLAAASYFSRRPTNYFGTYKEYHPVRNSEKPVAKKDRTYSLKHKDFDILVEGALAWATFMQEHKQQMTGGEVVRTYRQNRTLQKIDDEWKIINHTTIQTACEPKDFKHFDLIEQIAYHLWADKEKEKLLDVALCRHQWYPESAHSLFDIGWCYEKLGKDAEAKKYFQLSRAAIENDPWLGENLKAMLEGMLANRLDAPASE